jgi:hypothetical protein
MNAKLPFGFAAFALATAAAPFALAQNETSPTSTVSPAVAPSAPTGTTSPTPSAEPKKDEAVKEPVTEEKKEEPKLNPFRGSMFLFDQSILSSNLSKGGQLSYQPEYEWWISPRLYYSFDKHIRVGARFDFFKEMVTNHEETTTSREWRYGDPWVTASYGDKATFLNSSPKSRWALGVTARPPMSKESRANGQYFGLGPNASMTYGIDFSKGAKWFSGMSIGASVSYSHSFTKATTPSALGDGFSRPRTDPAGNAIISDQLRSGTLAGNSLIYALNAELEIHEDISFSGSMIVINQFSYKAPDVVFDGQPVAHNVNNTNFRQLTWFLLDLDYSIIPELSASLGYYNLNGAISGDGSRRNVLWSPESRIFFSLTANLDALYDDASKSPKAPKATAKSTPLGIF